MRRAPIAPNSPREMGSGVIIPREIQIDRASKSNERQTICFFIADPAPANTTFVWVRIMGGRSRDKSN
jgi:hypothetical protein